MFRVWLKYCYNYVTFKHLKKKNQKKKSFDSLKHCEDIDEIHRQVTDEEEDDDADEHDNGLFPTLMYLSSGLVCHLTAVHSVHYHLSTPTTCHGLLSNVFSEAIR